MIYRRIPREIEAFQYDGNVKDSNGKYYIPDWAIKPFEDGTMYFDNKERKPPCGVYIRTKEELFLHAEIGDYIVLNEHGEIYPCKKTIFEMQYEAKP